MKKNDHLTWTFLKADFFARNLLLVIFLFSGNLTFASPHALTYQGRIIKGNGTPLEYNSVSFQFEITSPDGLCVVYREQVDGMDMTNSGGVFDVAIGGGVQSYPNNGTFSLLDAFNNSTNFTCDGGSSYPAAAGDNRKLRVKFHDGNGWKTISPDSVIRAVPFAGYALSAQKLGNNVAGDFLTKAGLPTCTAGTFLSWDGTSLACIPIAGASGGTVTDVSTSNSYISIVNNTSTPQITLNVGTAANTVAAGNDTRIVNAMQAGATAGGDLSGTYPNPKVVQLQGTAVSNSAPANGQFFKFNGTNWAPTVIASGDVSGLAASLSSYLTQAAFNGYVASAGCSVSQTMYWNSVSSNFQCQAINVGLAGDVTGSIGAAKVVALQNYSVDTTAPTNNQVLQWNGTKWAPTSLDAAGIVDKTNTQTISGAKTFTNYLQMNSTNEIRFADADSSNYVGFKSPATVTANKVWVLPAADGTNGQVLATDGVGALSWSTPSAGGSLPAAAGTAAAPGYAFSGDTNTGMFGVSADVLGFSTNGTERVRISSVGNVGIGTATPAGILDVQGGSAAANTAGTHITIKAQNATGPAGGVGGSIALTPGDGAASWPGGSVVISTTDGQNGAITAYNNTTSNYVTSSASSAGPSFVLQIGNNYNLNNNTALINGDVKNSSGIYQDGYMGFVSVTGAANYSPDFVMGMQTGSTAYQERFRIIGSSGNVGIGTTTPASKLDVAGSVRVGTDASACAAGISGAIRYNAGVAEYCNGSAWQKLAGYAGTAANGQLLIGNGTGFGLANITQGAGITITNSAGGITIAASGGGGSVTSVSSSSTDIGVATGTSTPLLTLNSGTSGGAGDADKIPKMNASGQLAAAMIPNLDASKTASGVFPIARGGTNSSTALANNRIMASTGGAIVEAAAITANRALISDANGIPTQSAVTNTELGYLSGVTSSVQAQIDAKPSSAGWTNFSAMGVNGAGALTALPGSTSGTILNWTVTGPTWTTASFPTSTTANQLMYSSANNVVGGLATANNAILTTNGTGVPGWSVISADSFTQYALLAGRAGGQTLNGGNAASNNLILDSTAHATKGNIVLASGGGNVGIGTAGPASKLQVSGAVTNTVSTFSGAFTCGTSTIDFSTSNFQRLSPSGAIAAGSCTTTLSNLVAGGSYTLVMTGNAVTNAVLYSFSGYTFKYLPANVAIAAGKDAIYTFLYDGTTVYVTWAGGY